MKIGDWVTYRYEGYNSLEGQGIIIGEPRYSSEKAVVLMVADKEKLGMPIAAKWCRSKNISDVRSAILFHRRYEQRWPGHLKPLKFKIKPTETNVSS